MSAGLVRAAEVLRERRARGEKIGQFRPTERAARNPRSKQLAIEAYCYQCNGEDADPGWKWRLGNCEMTDCPLWPFRPNRQMHGQPMPAAMLDDADTSDFSVQNGQKP